MNEPLRSLPGVYPSRQVQILLWWTEQTVFPYNWFLRFQRPPQSQCDHHMTWVPWQPADSGLVHLEGSLFNESKKKANLSLRSYVDSLQSRIHPRGYFRNVWMGTSRWDTGPLPYSRPSSAEFCHPILDQIPQIPPDPRVDIFHKRNYRGRCCLCY